jgi:hypothetical protein
VEERKRQEIYFTRAKGAEVMAETAPQYPEPHFYTREFKLEAVRLSDNTDKSVAQIARELGVPDRVSWLLRGSGGEE